MRISELRKFQFNINQKPTSANWKRTSDTKQKHRLNTRHTPIFFERFLELSPSEPDLYQRTNDPEKPTQGKARSAHRNLAQDNELPAELIDEATIFRDKLYTSETPAT